jgi:hypothetical protein
MFCISHVDMSAPVYESPARMTLVSSLALMADNRIICVYFAAGGIIDGRISADNGRTWGPAFRIMQKPRPDYDAIADATVIVSGKRVIVVATGVPRPGKPLVDTYELLQTHSDDFGKTWSSPRVIDINHRLIAASGRAPAILSDGTILLPVWWEITSEKLGVEHIHDEGDMVCVSGVLISHDGGERWASSQDVLGPKREGSEWPWTADEPAIVAINDRDIFMVMRTLANGRALESWSHDGGMTWSAAEPGRCHAYNTPTGLCRLKNGWVVRLWDNSKWRHPLVAAISKDGCKTWSPPRTIMEWPEGVKSGPVNPQASYPNVVEAADGSLVATWCVFDAPLEQPDTIWHLVCGRFSADWVLGR